MPNESAISLYQLTRGWLDQLEVEFINSLTDSRAADKVEQSPYTQNRIQFAVWQLATLRVVRQRIPKAWKKAFVLEQH